MKTISISQWVAAAANGVAASRQSAAVTRNHLRRSPETPLRNAFLNPKVRFAVLLALGLPCATFATGASDLCGLTNLTATPREETPREGTRPTKTRGNPFVL